MAVEGAGKLLTFDPPQEIEQPARRKPGRPKGSPRVPGSGRKAGTPNRTTAEIRELIQKRGRPVELLCAIAAGRRVKVGRGQYAYPDLQERAAAAKLLLDKLVPPPKPTDDDGDRALNVEVVKFGHEAWLDEMEGETLGARRTREIETARRVAFALARGAQNSEPGAFLRDAAPQPDASEGPVPGSELPSAVYPHPGTPKEPEATVETSSPEGPQTEAPIEEPEPEAEPERAPPDPGPPAASYLAAGQYAWQRELASQRALASRPTLEPAGPTERFRRNR